MQQVTRHIAHWSSTRTRPPVHLGTS